MRLLEQRARKAEPASATALIQELTAVDECWLVYPAAGPRGQGRPRLVTKLSECSPQLRRLLEATGALAFAPTA